MSKVEDEWGGLRLEDLEVKGKIKEMIETGQVDIAKVLIREFEGLKPRDADIYLWKADISLLEHKYEEAQRVLIEAIGFAHQQFGLYYKLANLYRLKNNPTLAASLFIRAIELTENECEKAAIRQSIAEIGGKLCSVYDTDNCIPLNQPLVSIVVLAYNHLAYTKQCVDSIYRFTSHLPFELITVNNGSSDGTEAYFAGLPNIKKITLATNVGPVNGFNAGMIVADGIYTACISNDFIVTEGWLDNLLTCIASDETFGFVSPGASSVSNHQQITCPETDLEEMQRFAKSYNVSNPLKWEERVRLMPCVLMVRTDLLKQVGYFDPQFYFGEFADDDISFRIRRAGYKLIFAKDTYTHHFGSITTGEKQRTHQSLEVSRKIFRDKYGIDAWDDANFDLNLVITAFESMKKLIEEKESSAVRILGINSRCGSTPLQLRNKLREGGYRDITIVNYTDKIKYLEDLLTVSDTAMHGAINELKNCQCEAPYDVIILEGGLESYTPVDSVIGDIRSLLRSGGSFQFKVQNGAHFLQIARMLNDRSFIESRVSSTFFHLHSLLALLENNRLQVRKILLVQDSVHPQLADLYRKMEELCKTDEVLKDALLSVLEMIVVVEAV
jgi:GT2 family glycosyltransferase